MSFGSGPDQSQGQREQLRQHGGGQPGRGTEDSTGTSDTRYEEQEESWRRCTERSWMRDDKGRDYERRREKVNEEDDGKKQRMRIEKMRKEREQK